MTQLRTFNIARHEGGGKRNTFTIDGVSASEHNYSILRIRNQRAYASWTRIDRDGRIHHGETIDISAYQLYGFTH